MGRIDTYDSDLRRSMARSNFEVRKGILVTEAACMHGLRQLHCGVIVPTQARGVIAVTVLMKVVGSVRRATRSLLLLLRLRIAGHGANFGAAHMTPRNELNARKCRF